ncbi:MAG: right-handed parallel beta-helix repeat-containing protein, partial [Thermoplasmata archaeon]|nr:right-handed parallel beta-helix repeat-containing protein [Thermoplasmata archaeon]
MKKGMGKAILGIVIGSIILISISPNYGSPSGIYYYHKWALIFVSTNDISNQSQDAFPAQGLQAYYILKKHGYLDDNIVFALWHNNDDYISIYGNHNDLLGPPPQIGGPDESPEIDFDENSPLPAGVSDWNDLLHYCIDWIASHAGTNDDVVIYIVNHGEYDNVTGKALFGFEDGSSLPEDVFDSWIDNIHCRRMTVLVDACYSGDFIDAPVDVGFDSGIDSETNRILVSSAGNCIAFSYAEANGSWAGSLFFHPFFEALDGGISIKDAYEYACSFIPPGHTENVTALQNPQLVDKTGESKVYTFLDPLFVWVDDDYDAATPGWQIDHFSSLKNAVNAVAPYGRIYVYDGIYDEEIVVDKSMVIEGIGTPKIQTGGDGIFIKADDVELINLTIDAKGNGIILQHVHNVSILQCNVSNAALGVYSINSINCSIKNSSIYKNGKGIYLSNSSNFIIRNSTILNNAYFGIEISHASKNNLIESCNIMYNGIYGLYIIQDSTGNKIWHNNFIGNTAYDSCNNDFNSKYEDVKGNYWSDYNGIDQKHGENQDMDGEDGIGDTPYTLGGGGQDAYPLVYPIVDPPYFVWVNKKFNHSYNDHFPCIQDAIKSVANDGGCFVFPDIYKEDVIINKKMLLVGYSNKNTFIEGNNSYALHIKKAVKLMEFGIRNTWSHAGVRIEGNDSSISSCDIYNDYYGIVINATNVKIENASIHGNTFIGIVIQSDFASIRNCNITENNKGILLHNASNALIKKCIISNNSVTGIEIENSSSIEMCYNTIENNFYGMYVDAPSSSLAYLNDFINNFIQVCDYESNAFDNGSIGNYWSDYNGSDANHDGIGDTPYSIDNDSIDYKPLIRKAGLPIAYFHYEPSNNITTKDIIHFYDDSIDLDGTITSWLWDFGDGNTSNEQNPEHSYGNNGNYTVTLNVWDNEGNTACIEAIITVANVPPVANFTWQPANPTDLDTVQFTSTSYDSDGTIVNYTWNFGDGSIAYGSTVTHRYDDNGTY